MTGTAPARAAAVATGPMAAARRPYLDNLKVALIAVIIVIHAILGYAGMVLAWTYADVREVTLAPATEIALFLVAAPFALFLIALLFLVAGLLTPGSRERKGTARFAWDRAVRLGIPFAVYVFIIQPLLLYGGARLIGLSRGTLREEWFGPEHRLDTGPLWFVGVLLVFSLGYAAWSALRERSFGRRHGDPASGGRAISVSVLAVLAVVVAPASFAIRLVWPYGSESGVSDLNFWEWPACLAVFGLGVAAADKGWLDRVPTDLVRRCGIVTGAAIAALIALLVVTGLRDGITELQGGWNLTALTFACLDAVLTVFGSVWLLGLVQRRFDRVYRLGPTLARSAYGAFILQTAFLLGIAIVLRPLGVPAEVKAALVACGALVGSFGAAWLLVRFVPGVRRVL